MSKTIQEALDLPVLEDLLKNRSEHHEVAVHENANDPLPPLDEEEETVRKHEASLDEVYDTALQHSKDLMDLGYNVDTRSAGKMFENAATMLKIAMDARNSKRDAQLKAAKLKIEDRKVQVVEKQYKGDEGTVEEGESTVVHDRNELIKMMRQQPKE